MDINSLRERLYNLKQSAYSEMSHALSCKDIIKKAIKIRFPNIPEKANDTLASKLMYLDNDEILKMGKEEIAVSDLISDIVMIIGDFMSDIDKENL